MSANELHQENEHTVRVSTTLVTDGVEGNNAANAFRGMYDCGVGIVMLGWPVCGLSSECTAQNMHARDCSTIYSALWSSGLEAVAVDTLQV